MKSRFPAIRFAAATAIVLGLCLMQAAPSPAQSTSASGQTQTQNQVTQQNLPPASTCFNCDCNTQDFACRTACTAITDFTRRQQCEAACGQTQADCLSRAQRLQRAQDEQRNLTQQSTASGRTN
ncbi:hypothetical protein [Fundidesulfovibrio putealis]|uniref:hypothetical protein n=1 Tax=Fundidesulfovibrio putealis TaxID=270496 RepID=UPI00040CA8EC|nr:hypothetical protein [Fundidesulfovibrio putealis]